VTLRDLTGLPSIAAAGLDVGATKTHMRYLAPGAEEPSHLTLRTSDHDSLEHLITSAFHQAGCVPQRVVAGVAGRIENNGDVQMTNQDWPLFDHDRFQNDTGVEMRMVNDLYSQLAGIAVLDDAGSLALTPQLTSPEGPAKLIMAMGSGIGGAFMDPGGVIHPAEPGHMSWQPTTELEYELLREVQRKNPGRSITAEETVTGLYGWDLMYDFISPRTAPSAKVLEQVQELRAKGEGVGPAVSVGVLEDDECCLQILDLYGGLVGQYLRDIALITLIERGGPIYLSGSVMQANRGAEMLFAKTAFHDRFVSRGSMFDDFLATIPFYLVTDPHVAVKGAYQLASSTN
jgi:glucokinase